MPRPGLDYGRTLTLGFGFLAVSLTWSVYNAFVPVFYERFVQSGALIGLLMITDNIVGVTLQPWIAGRSDRTRTRLGRRMPYLLVGAPLAAAFLALIPLHTSLITLLAAALGMNLATGLYRAPAVALMPDITPRPLRSQANGIINLMGGLGAVIAFFLAAPLFRLDQRLPFLVAAGAALLAVLVLYWRIKEPPRPGGEESARKVSLGTPVLELLRPSRRNALYLLLAIFAYFVGHQAVEAFFTLYAIDRLGADAAAGAATLGFFAAAFLAFAVPAGFFGGRFGRRPAVGVGLAFLLVVFAAASQAGSVRTVQALFVVAGLAWALINVNAYPMLLDLAPEAETGAYTGLYYFFASAAAITGPPLIGLLRDLFGFGPFFLYAMVPLAVSLILLRSVRGGG